MRPGGAEKENSALFKSKEGIQNLALTRSSAQIVTMFFEFVTLCFITKAGETVRKIVLTGGDPSRGNPELFFDLT